MRRKAPVRRPRKDLPADREALPFLGAAAVLGACDDTVMMFIPLSMTSLGSIPKKDIAASTALYNLTRQLGGSVGVALLSTILGSRRRSTARYSSSTSRSPIPPFKRG